MSYSLSFHTVRGVLVARILECFAILSSSWQSFVSTLHWHLVKNRRFIKSSSHQLGDFELGLKMYLFTKAAINKVPQTRWLCRGGHTLLFFLSVLWAGNWNERRQINPKKKKSVKKFITYVWGIYINMKCSKDRQDEVYIRYYHEVYIQIYNVYIYTLFWTKEKKVSV